MKILNIRPISVRGMMGIKGKIFKILAGVYYINTESGIVEAKAKGNFRNKKI